MARELAPKGTCRALRKRRRQTCLQGKPTATPRYPRTSGGYIGPGTMNDAACAPGARTEQPPGQLVAVKKRRLTARFPAEPELDGRGTASGFGVALAHVCREN